MAPRREAAAHAASARRRSRPRDLIAGGRRLERPGILRALPQAPRQVHERDARATNTRPRLSPACRRNDQWPGCASTSALARTDLARVEAATAGRLPATAPRLR